METMRVEVGLKIRRLTLLSISRGQNFSEFNVEAQHGKVANILGRIEHHNFGLREWSYPISVRETFVHTEGGA